MTGRAAGFCAGYPVPGFMNAIPGRGFWGWGRGFRGAGGWARAGVGFAQWGAPAFGAWAGQVTPQQELDGLKGQEEYLVDALEGIRKRMGELEAAAEKK